MLAAMPNKPWEATPDGCFSLSTLADVQQCDEGAIYLYDWYSRYTPSHLYEGIICGIDKSIISI